MSAMRGRFAFSQAVRENHVQWKNRVRPDETLANEDDVESVVEEESESEEGRQIAGQKAIYKPTQGMGRPRENSYSISSLVSILREGQVQEQSTWADQEVI